VNFGLINRVYDADVDYDLDDKKTQWQRFERQVFRLNRDSGRNIQYKVLYMGRHGEGLHNVAESFYGTPAWDVSLPVLPLQIYSVDNLLIIQCYWSKLDGNGTITWADAHLTDKGVEQAYIANRFWATEIATQKIPVPESYYTSPLARCLATADITFSGLSLPSRKPFLPVVKEVSHLNTLYSKTHLLSRSSYFAKLSASTPATAAVVRPGFKKSFLATTSRPASLKTIRSGKPMFVRPIRLWMRA